MESIQGIAASEGAVIGKALIFRHYSHGDYTREIILKENLEKTLESLSEAMASLKREFEQRIEKAKGLGKTSTVAVMEAHVQILEDVELVTQINHRIKDNLQSARAGVQSVFNEWIDCFNQLEDPYLRERSHDLEDICQQLLNKLSQVQLIQLDKLEHPVILVANDVTPSMLASADTSQLLGVISEVGSKTSHAAILANNLGLPAILGVKDATHRIEEDAIIYMDGTKGIIKTDLSETDLENCLKTIEQSSGEQRQVESFKEKRTKTKDGFEIELSANIMSLEDALLAVSEGAEGVGLFRTEFLFMDRLDAPSEEEQYKVYAKTAEVMAEKPVIIRTMDIGGDKKVDYLKMEKEENPFLGLRALRLSFERERIFMTQLRAILRASAHGNLKIMFPMVASLEELLKAKEWLKNAMNELKEEGYAFNESIPVGVMIEIPSAAIIADQLIKHCDFFSIGTNDLTQYTLAVDRMNEHIAHLYNPVHPAMLRLIRQVAQAANSQESSKFAGMCGELAGNTQMAKLLIGLGLTELSMSPRKIAKMRFAISQFTQEEARSFAETVLSLESVEAINQALA